MNFYTKNSVIFLTGATGFTGKVLLEKILRSLPQVKKIYLLVRCPTAKTVQCRVEEEIFSSPIFETIRAQFENELEFRRLVMSKIVPVHGDLILEHLGLSESDLRMVQSDTNVIFNCAADTSWDRGLKEAVNLNCYGPLRMIKVAQGMQHLSAFVHLSTAFVNIHMDGQVVGEKIYPFRLGDTETVFDKIEKMIERGEDFDSYECDVLRVFENTYIASKSLTESLFHSRYKQWQVPIVIVRPSAIGGTLSEPVAGWVEGMTGLAACSVLCGLGVIQEWAGKSYWQSANPPPRGRISTDIRAHMYSIQDFESRFRQRFSEELVLALKKNEEDLRRLLANAYRIPRLYGKMYKYDCHFSAANTLALDKAAPAVLSGNMSLGIDWPEYLHKGNMGIHKHILKETVDRRVVVDYTWESIQRQYKPTESSVVSNGSDDSPTKSRL
ncbi:cyclin-dependent kinase inhibitor far1 [Linnemannia elongata]|nr:cyclin-dependent kinase inhibitor far1 [Linnemannia elongata]KAG0079884.1 cyclin-dependent kinase inhibitor far1 [Linnemannia elongata]